MALALMASMCFAGEPAVIELTKQEALDLVVSRDQVEEAMTLLAQRRERFNQLLNDTFEKYGVTTDTYGWLPPKGQLVPLKSDEKTDTSSDTDSKQ